MYYYVLFYDKFSIVEKKLEYLNWVYRNVSHALKDSLFLKLKQRKSI